jgi:hypothetical protein
LEGGSDLSWGRYVCRTTQREQMQTNVNAMNGFELKILVFDEPTIFPDFDHAAPSTVHWGSLSGPCNGYDNILLYT